jgi:hypothetical protein
MVYIQMIGTQRSGSNLLRLMLNQLQSISAPHPPHILERLMPLLPAYGNISVPVNFAQLVEDVCLLVENNPVPWSDVELNRQAIIAHVTSPTLPEITRVIYELKAKSDQANIWMCKSMANIHYADELEKYAVKPLYLHLFRDGRDVALSFKKAIVGEKHMYHIAQQWKIEQDKSLQLFQKLGANRVIQVRYEDLLSNPQNVLANLCQFIGTEYSDHALDYHQSTESKETANSGLMWQNVVKPVLANNHTKFVQELSEEDILIFEQVAGDTLEALGYNRHFPEAPNKSFTRQEINLFSAENNRMKQETRLKLKPEDLLKRKGQEDLLRSISSRMPALQD